VSLTNTETAVMPAFELVEVIENSVFAFDPHPLWGVFNILFVSWGRHQDCRLDLGCHHVHWQVHSNPWCLPATGINTKIKLNTPLLYLPEMVVQLSNKRVSSPRHSSTTP
jgi:hypothetical protein